MKLRTRLNLVVTGLTAVFMAVLITSEIRDTRASVREEIEAANRVASQLLERLATIYSREGGPQVVLEFLQQLGHVRSNDILLRARTGEILYHSPPPTYKAGREAPAWFSHLLAPNEVRQTFFLPEGVQLVVEAQTSRSVLDAWDDLTHLLILAAIMLIAVNGLTFWLIDRALAPFPIIARGLERIQRGELTFRLPPLPGTEAGTMGAAFNRMAQSVENNVQVERKARETEDRLEERRDMAKLVEQRVEEERRLIAHELHDEFGQSVTAIRSLALAIVAQTKEPAQSDTAQLISDEAARLYDAMHGLIPRLMPLSLDTLGLAETLENLIRDWRRRYPTVALSLRHDLPDDLGPSITLALYRVVQEGLINALRHAQASHVNISLESVAQSIIATITDDGVGLPHEWSRPGHFGLRGLTERVEHLGGSFAIRNREPHGVTLRAQIPLSTEAVRHD